MSILHGTTGHVISTLQKIDSMAARIDKIVISELAATDLPGFFRKREEINRFGKCSTIP